MNFQPNIACCETHVYFDVLGHHLKYAAPSFNAKVPVEGSIGDFVDYTV
jgi:hypothetical protein